MDHRDLLRRYIIHVRRCGGADFVSCIESEYENDVPFSRDEMNELLALSNVERQSSLDGCA